MAKPFVDGVFVYKNDNGYPPLQQIINANKQLVDVDISSSRETAGDRANTMGMRILDDVR